jgi:hypothetical protein
MRPGLSPVAHDRSPPSANHQPRITNHSLYDPDNSTNCPS